MISASLAPSAIQAACTRNLSLFFALRSTLSPASVTSIVAAPPGGSTVQFGLTQ